MDISELAHHGPENLLISGIMIFASFFYLMSINLPLTLIVFACVPLLLFVAAFYRKKMRAAFLESRKSIAKISADAILWDDPLLGITCNEFPAIAPDLMEKLIENYQQLREYTAPYRHDNCAGSIGYAWNIADAVTRKLQIRKRLCEAYRSGDIAGLKELCSADIPELLSSLEELQKEFRRQWLRNFKHFGLEINQIRIAGIAERYRELQRVLDESIRGESTTIPALDNRLKPAALTGFHYRHIATGNFFI